MIGHKILRPDYGFQPKTNWAMRAGAFGDAHGNLKLPADAFILGRTMAQLPISLSAIRAFEAIGRLGGIRRAAAALGVSHAIVSRHLKTVEAQTGVILFDRGGGRLTAAGSMYHSRISRAFAEIHGATNDLTALRGDRFVIGCVPGLASQWLTPRLAHFSPGYNSPVVELLALDDRPDLASHEIDGEIRYSVDIHRNASQGPARNVRELQLARPPVLPVTSPSLAQELGLGAKCLTDLATLPLLDEGAGEEWRLWLAAKGVNLTPKNIVARYGQAHLTLAAARAGQGIALSNPYLLGDDIASGRLVALGSLNSAFSPMICGAYVFRTRRALWTNPIVERFRKWLLGELSQTQLKMAAAIYEPIEVTAKRR
jgi:DNA-binding transcriptional LysR family regulator